jgi:Co/Zn/Cd efflux system component
LAAGAVWEFDCYLADPIASVEISALVVYSSLPLLKQTVAILMEIAPGHIDVARVRDAMAATPGVLEVHPGLSFDVAIRDRSVVVRVSAPLDLPVTVDGITDTRADARGAAVVEVGE